MQVQAQIQDLEPVEVKSRATGELFTLARLLTENTGITAFSVMHESLLPGHRSSRPHRHSQQDEMYVVLTGSPTAYLDDTPHPLQPGSYLVFKSGSPQKHMLQNETDQPVELLKISSSPADDKVIY